MKRVSHPPFEASAWLVAIVESSRDAIISKDLDGIIRSWNKGAEDVFGYAADEAVGMPVTMLMPADRATEEPGILAMIRRGEKVEHFETIRRRKDGRLIDVSLTISPILDADGRVVGASKIARDITERKRNFAELQKLAAIVESSSDAIISKDLDGIIRSWNKGAERIFGYTAKEVVGKPVTILMPAELVDEEPGILARIRRGEAVNHYETIRRRKDGTLIDISLTVSPVRDAHGVVVGASKIARDITEHKRVESAIRESEMMHRLVETQEAERTRIARDLHDHIGQTLTAIRLKLERLMEMTGDTALLDEITSIRAVAKRMDRDVGFLSRELRPTDLDNLGLVNAVGAFVREWSQQFDIPAEFKFVSAKRSRDLRISSAIETNLYRIVQEALNNVVKHADASHASVLIHSTKEGITLIVEDDGRGFNIDAPPAGANNGFGLVGMRERAELLGGTLDVESDPGKGTSLLIEIPRDPNRSGSRVPAAEMSGVLTAGL